MIITCYDCPDPMFPDSAKTWRYPCEDCATEFVDKHRAMGHEVHTRAETSSDKYVFTRL